MADQGETRERQKLNGWLRTLRPEMVIKELATAWLKGWPRDRVEGNIYYKVIKVEPLTLELLYTEKQLGEVDGRLRIGRGAIVGSKDYEVADLRPVEADEYREMLMAMFGD